MATQITNSLLKEAIADAEAVRETAVANAKLVLEESMSPQIKDMIARRLRVEAEYPSTEGDKEEVEGSRDLETAPPEGGAEFPADDSTIGDGENKEPSEASDDTSEIGEADAPEGTDDNWYNDWDEADFELDSIIKELEEDIAALTGKDTDGDGDVDQVAIASKDAEPVGGDEAPAADAPVAPEAPAAEVPAPEAPDAEKAPEDSLAPEAPTGDDEELDLDEFLAELEAEDQEGKKSVFSDKDAMAAKLAGLKNDLAQYKEAVSIMRERLSEVNLLNAKLLFTNKMFRKDSLSNEQKIRIIESFDRATTVREVKLVYTALVENLASAARSFNQNTSRKKVVAEGIASKVIPSSAPRTKKEEVIVESALAQRMKELAGLLAG